MKSEAQAFGEAVCDLVAEIRPLLAGKEPELQSAALADLVSMWLCGLVVLNDPEQTREIRTWAFTHFIALVKDLTDSGVNEPRGGQN